MNTNRNKTLIVNYIFVFGILLLFLNDQFFKFQYSNFLTGKLSDICGIIIFPMLLSYIFPKLKENSVFLSAAIFTFWKSEFSQSAINLYNKYSFIETSRIVDYSDLYVLMLLPIPYFFIKNISKFDNVQFKNLNSKLVFVLSLFIFISEAPPPNYYFTITDGNLKCYKCKITLDIERNELLKKMEQKGIKFDSIKPIRYRGVIDSVNGVRQYVKKELIIDSDTLKNVDFTIFSRIDGKSTVYFNGMDVPQNLKNNTKLERKLRKYYKKLLFKEIKQAL